MALKDLTDISLELDVKYNMKRPGFTKSDLKSLKEIFIIEQNKNPCWKDEWVKEDTLIRFLKANVTVEDSLQALIIYCKWRVNYDVDNISPVDKDIQKEALGRRERILESEKDACGRPVIILYPRLHDMNHGDYPSLYKYITLKMEELCLICDQIGHDGTFCLVIDMKDFSMKNMDYTAVRKILWILKSCCPETLGVCLIINYSWLFYGCWEIIKYWLNEVTKSKIHFCTRNEMNDFLDIEACDIEILR